MRRVEVDNLFTFYPFVTHTILCFVLTITIRPLQLKVRLYTGFILLVAHTKPHRINLLLSNQHTAQPTLIPLSRTTSGERLSLSHATHAQCTICGLSLLSPRSTRTSAAAVPPITVW